MIVNKRYQECNIFEKLYRRLRYQPYYFIVACIAFIKQEIAHYHYEDEDGTRKYYKSSFIFSLIYCEWQFKANWVYYHEEVFGDDEKNKNISV